MSTAAFLVSEPQRPTTKTKVLTGSGSLLLDSLRIIAALTVLVSHGYDQWFPTAGQGAGDTGKLAHAAVVIFFVLSGFVIAYTTTSRNRGPRDYAVARLSRLSSVVLPALAFTVVIQFVVSFFDPGINAHNWIIKYILTASFLNEIWFLSAAPYICRSLWSLGFEFWYYVIFGAYFFRRQMKWGTLLVLLLCVFAGPKILLMMPIWIAGCFAFWLPSPKINRTAAWATVFGLLALAVIMALILPSFPKSIGTKPFFFANQFVTDWAVGLLVALALWCIPFENWRQTQPLKTQWVRKLADLTFPIYVLHLPILVLFRMLFPFQVANAAQLSLALTGSFILSLVLGIFLERQRPVWVRFFKWFFSAGKHFVAKLMPAPQTSSKQA